MQCSRKSFIFFVFAIASATLSASLCFADDTVSESISHGSQADSSLRAGLPSKARQPHIEVELIAEKAAKGQRARVGVLFKPDPDWHIYWRNPGDTGLAPVINWQGAAELGELQWPYPEYIPIAHLVNLGYHHQTLLWTSYTAEAGANIDAKVDWLVCKEACIPGSASLSIDPSAIADEDSLRASSVFDQWQQRLPQSLNVMSAEAAIDDKRLILTIYANNMLFDEQSEVQVFIENLDLVVYGEPIRQRAANNVLIWEQNLSEFKSSDPQLLEAVIVINQQEAYSLAIPIKKV